MIKYVRDDKGNYQIKNKPYVSVTTVQGRVCGMYESLMNNYHCKLCKNYNEGIVNNHPFDVADFTFDQLNMGIIHAKNDREGKAEYGTQAHKTLENIFFSSVPIPIDFIKRVEHIKQIYSDFSLELVYPESTIYSDNLESAGSADIIAVSRKFTTPRLYIVDYKTGSANKKKECVQLGAYGRFVVEMIKNKDLFVEGLGDKFTVHGMVLHIGRSDDEKVKPTFLDSKQMKLGGNAYKNLLAYYRFTKDKL